MKAPVGLGRNDVLKAVAVVSIVVFPLIANAQLGRSSGAVKTSQDASPGAATEVTTAAAKPNSCADQHWPLFSADCLRGSTQPVEPRLVSMNVESSPNSAIAGDAPKVTRTADVVRKSRQSVGWKKSPKRHIATHRRERRSPNVAAHVDTAQISMPGW